MKKITPILIASIAINFSLDAQIAGDYRSIGSGPWNDATKWETYNGSSWVSTTVYPGQSSGTGVVTIATETEITITAAVPHPISSLYISTDLNQVVPLGKLVFGSTNATSLAVTGNIFIYGSLLINDQTGAKSHSLFIGGSLEAGTWLYVWDSTCTDFFSCPGYYSPIGGNFQSINNDDKLRVIFNTTAPNSSIRGSAGLSLQDVDFNGIGISVETQVYINGATNFINGIVKSNNVCDGGIAIDASGSSYNYTSICPVLYFNQQATVSGSSSASFVDGRVWKDVNNSFTFPIGNGGVYSPLTVTTPAGHVGTLSARYVRSVQNQVSWGIADSGLYSVSDCESWDVNAGSAFYYGNNNVIDYPADITVGWNNFSSCGTAPYVTNASEVKLAHLNFTDKTWKTHGGLASGTNENGTVTWGGVTNLGTFTLANLNTNCTTPSQIITTNISAYAATLNWSSVAGSASYDVDYMPATTNHWTNAATAITSTSFNLSGLNPLVTYYWRVRANCGPSSSAYRLTQFTTLNPCDAPSGLTTTNITSTSATLNWNAVSNASNYTVGYKESTSTSWLYPALGIGSLSCTLTGLLPGTAYDWRVNALCSNGLYSNIQGNLAQASFTTLATTSVCNDLYETNNISGQAKAISLGNTISALISSPTDVDWFTVAVPGNSNIVLSVFLSNLPADFDLYVYNKNLALVGSSTTNGNEVVTFDVRGRNSMYYIKIVGKYGAYNASQCYNLSASQLSNNTRVTGRTIEPRNEPTNTSDEQLLYPNPASEFVSLRFSSAEEGLTHGQLLNSGGQMVKVISIKVVKGFNETRIPVSDLRPGVYVLKINDHRFNLVRKFVVAR